MLASRKVPVIPTLSGKQSEEYHRGFDQSVTSSRICDLYNEVLGSDRKVA